jgi:hypothetical protein
MKLSSAQPPYSTVTSKRTATMGRMLVGSISSPFDWFARACSIESQGVGRGQLPADDHPAEGVEDEREEDEPLPAAQV